MKISLGNDRDLLQNLSIKKYDSVNQYQAEGTFKNFNIYNNKVKHSDVMRGNNNRRLKKFSTL